MIKNYEKTAKMKKIHCPQYLSKEARRLWNEIIAEYSIVDAAGIKILLTALEAFDRAKKCRETIDQEGMQIKDRFGIPKPHPLLAAERDARSQFLHGLKNLNLDLDPVRDNPGRPGGK
jgi:P27 family predicted phage terminase small subunit